MKKSCFSYSLIPIFAGMTFVIPNTQGQEVWTSAGGACVIDEDSTTRAQMDGGRFKFQAGQVGTIYARCNVTNPRDNGADTVWNHLELAYNDPDGPLNASRVRAFLRRVSNATGGIWDMAIFDSNIEGCGGQCVGVVVFPWDFTFNTHAYYVQLEIRRDNANSDPSVSIVRLKD
jgi:hypothetical protein